MRILALGIALSSIPVAAIAAGEAREVACFAGEHRLYEGCARDVELGLHGVIFTDCRTGRRTWIHADCVVTWDHPAAR